MNRRGFLKAITAMVGAAAIPTAIVEACQIDSQIPKDWVVGLLDESGSVFAQTEVDTLGEAIVFGSVTKTGVVTHLFVEGAGISGRMIAPITMQTKHVCAGDYVHVFPFSIHES